MTRTRTWQRLVHAGAALIALALPAALSAQRTHVLIVAGLSGDPAFRRTFDASVKATAAVASAKWGVSDSSLFLLTEDSVATSWSRGRSTRENIGQAFTRLSRRVAPGDVVFVFLVGHGSGEGPTSKVNLPGPDATASEYAAWIRGFSAQQVVFVNAASGSGDFVPVLAGPGRVIVTATRSAVERNASVFGQHFAEAIGSDNADADKNGRLSVMEAFRYARSAVATSYETTNRMLTEHAVVSDSVRAATITFGTTATVASPRIAALIAERQALESQVAALRARKRTMTAAEYDTALETLLLAIAEKTQAIKAAGGAS